MNKLVIPTILLATVMVAGIFAFMPIEEASTVHNTIITEIGDQDRTIVYHQVFHGIGEEVTDDLIAFVLQSEDAYSGTAFISATSIEEAGSGTPSCDATFNVRSDTDNDGVSDATISTVSPADDNATDTDTFNNVDQIFLNTVNVVNDAENICSVSVILFLDGTET